MYGLKTLEELNEAATKSLEKGPDPSPSPGEAKPLDAQAQGTDVPALFQAFLVAAVFASITLILAVLAVASQG